MDSRDNVLVESVPVANAGYRSFEETSQSSSSIGSEIDENDKESFNQPQQEEAKPKKHRHSRVRSVLPFTRTAAPTPACGYSEMSHMHIDNIYDSSLDSNGPLAGLIFATKFLLGRKRD